MHLPIAYIQIAPGRRVQRKLDSHVLNCIVGREARMLTNVGHCRYHRHEAGGI